MGNLDATFPIAVTSTIAASGSNGEWVDTQHFMHWGIVLPAALTGTALTFEGWSGENSPSSSATGNAIKQKDGSTAAVTVTFAANVAVGFGADDMERLRPYRWVRPVSNGTEAADRDIIFMLK